MENRLFAKSCLIAAVLIFLLSILDPLINYFGLPWHYYLVRPLTVTFFLGLYFYSRNKSHIPEYYYELFSYALYFFAFYGIIFIGPAYTFCFMHVFIAIGILTHTSVNRFCLQAIIGTLLCIIGHYYAAEPRIIKQDYSVRPLLCLAAIIFQIISTFLYLFVTRYRLQINELNEKYALIGKNSSFLMHEIKTPIARVFGQTQGIHSHVLLENIHHDANKILSLINSVETLIYRPHDLAKNFKLFPLQLVKDQLLNDYSSYLKAINIYFKFDDPEVMIKGEPNLIYQLFKNIIENAIEAIGYQENETPLIHIFSQTFEERVEITIRNTHSFIAKQDLKSIFLPNFSTKQTIANRGLGLPLAKSITEAHGGSIQVESNDNYTEFRVALPR